MVKYEIVVDGTDGAGKTLTVKALAVLLKGKYKFVIHAPYKQQEVYPLWESNPQEAAKIITGIMDVFRQKNKGVDLILWDRGWPTAWVSTKDEAARKLFQPFPNLTVLLLNTPQVTMDKAKTYGITNVWVTDPKLVQKFNEEYQNLGPETGANLLRFFPNEAGLFDIDAVCKNIEKTITNTINRSLKSK